MKVNDRVTVKTDGGPRRPGVVLAIEEFSEGVMYRFLWKTTRSVSGSLTNWDMRMVFLWKQQNSVVSGGVPVPGPCG